MKYLFGIAIILTITAQTLVRCSRQPTNYFSIAERINLLHVTDELIQFAGVIESTIDRVLANLPESPSYDGHRENLREFQTVSHDFKEAECHCLKKVAQYFDELTQFLQTYSFKEAKTVEYHNLVILIDEQGLDYIRKNVESKRKRGDYRYLTLV